MALAAALTRESAKAGALADTLEALARAHGLSFWAAMGGSLVAWARLDAGDPAGAVTGMSDALAAGEAAGSGLLVGLYQSVLAEAAFRRALATAAEQKERLWELRAASELARLLAGQGRRQEALDLLAPVYGWFIEGFDTPDLVEAKALLEELQ